MVWRIITKLINKVYKTVTIRAKKHLIGEKIMIKDILKKSVIIAIITIFFIGSISLPVSSNENEFNFEAFNIDESTVKLLLDNIDYKFDRIYAGNEFYASIDMNEAGFTTITGQAKLPVISRMIEIPYGSYPEIFIKRDSWEASSLRELRLPDRVIPVQPSIEKDKERGSGEFVIDNEYYSTDIFMPNEITRVVETGMIRGRSFALVEISPIQYNPITGELKLLQSCELQINLNDGDLQQTSEKIFRYNSKSFEDLFSKLFENYGFYEEEMSDFLRDQEGYLIIVYDNFYDEILPLANWKQSLGFDVTVTTTSSIPGGVSTTTIHNYIEDAYDTWVIPPAYVLLVGDTGQIPTYSGTTGWPGPADAVDLYYATMDDGNYLPDLFIGRFPASQESHVTAMVDKTLYYEQGSFASTDWIKKAVFMAGNDNYQITEGTHNYVISNYLGPDDYTCDKLYEVTYGATTQDVRDSLNDGRSLAIYSGHGSTYSWGDGPPFSQSDVQGLLNQEIYPFVCSHACDTGRFNVGECFGETWLREPNKAGLAFWGGSSGTLWDEDDVLEKKMFYSWWVDGIETIGGMTDMGLYYLYQHYNGGGYTKYYFEAYNILGDPSVKVWRDEPNPGHLIYGYAYYGDISIPAVGAIVTIESPRTGESMNTVVDFFGYYEVNLDDLQDGWLHGDLILINVAGTGYYDDWFGEDGIIADEDVPLQQVNDIILSQYAEYTVVLYQGWNLITVPVENDYAAEDLGQAIDGCTVVCKFNAETQTYFTHVVGIPHNDFPILDGVGYYIYTTTDSIFSVSAQPIQTVNLPLFSGWNIVGWFDAEATTAESLGENISGCTVVTMFDAQNQQYVTHAVGIPHNDFQIIAGMGLYIYVSEPSTWHGEG